LRGWMRSRTPRRRIGNIEHSISWDVRML
jgi:hypothetical protein